MSTITRVRVYRALRRIAGPALAWAMTRTRTIRH